MSAPRIFFGQKGGNALFRLHTGATDGGVAFELLGQPDPVAPAGIGGECVFTAIFLAFSHEQPLSLLLTPIVDEVELTDAAYSIVLPARAKRTVETLEIPLSRPFQRDGVTRFRHYPRGTWFTYRLESVAGAGDLLGEGSELEFEVVRQGRKPA